MSHQVLSYGLMAPLVTPVTDPAEREELRERLYETSTLRLNYEGTLVYSDAGSSDDYHGAGIIFASLKLVTEFHEEVNKANLTVTHESVFYSCSWYNGTDSDMDDLTLADFLKRSGQEVSDVS